MGTKHIKKSDVQMTTHNSLSSGLQGVDFKLGNVKLKANRAAAMSKRLNEMSKMQSSVLTRAAVNNIELAQTTTSDQSFKMGDEANKIMFDIKKYDLLEQNATKMSKLENNDMIVGENVKMSENMKYEIAVKHANLSECGDISALT